MSKKEMPILIQIFAYEKNAKKQKKKRKDGSSAECAVPAGGKEGSKPSGVCETFRTTLHAIFLHARNHTIKVMQRVYARVSLHAKNHAIEVMQGLCKISNRVTTQI